MNKIAIDLETTGTSPLTDSPIQLGYLVADEQDQIIEKGSYYIKSTEYLKEEITKITGIKLAQINDEGFEMKEAAEKWNNLVWNYSPVSLIGYNILNFDFLILQNFLSANKTGNFKHPPISSVIDVLHLGRAFLNIRKYPKLAKMAQYLEIPFSRENLHDALADVTLTWEVYKALRKFIEEKKKGERL